MNGPDFVGSGDLFAQDPATGRMVSIGSIVDAQIRMKVEPIWQGRSLSHFKKWIRTVHASYLPLLMDHSVRDEAYEHSAAVRDELNLRVEEAKYLKRSAGL